jgi:hypothetical protein
MVVLNFGQGHNELRAYTIAYVACITCSGAIYRARHRDQSCRVSIIASVKGAMNCAPTKLLDF